MLLDLLAAQRVTQARVFEQAVHDPGPWTIRIQDVEVGAVRVRCPTRVVFLAVFPPRSWGEQSQTAWLSCRGELKSSKIVTVLDEEFATTWTFGSEPTREPAGT